MRMLLIKLIKMLSNEVKVEMNTSELTHWGIKGMKWGVRRYQNKDGSLTAAGEKRYGNKMDDPYFANDLKKYGVKSADKINQLTTKKGYTHRQAATYVTNMQKSKRELTKVVAGTTAITAASAIGAYYVSSKEFRSKLGGAIAKAKNMVDQYNNVTVIDKNGSVLAKYHQNIKVGKDIVDELLRR